MAEQQFPYDMMVQEALRSVVRQSLTLVCKDGFRGEHHFYITFKTQAPNVYTTRFFAPAISRRNDYCSATSILEFTGK